MFCVFLNFTSIPYPFLCIFVCLYLFPLSQKIGVNFTQQTSSSNFVLCPLVHSVQVQWFLYLFFMSFFHTQCNADVKKLDVDHPPFQESTSPCNTSGQNSPNASPSDEISQISLSQVVLQSIVSAGNYIFLTKKVRLFGK